MTWITKEDKDDASQSQVRSRRRTGLLTIDEIDEESNLGHVHILDL